MKKLLVIIVYGVLGAVGTVSAATVTVTMHKVDANGLGHMIGTIVFQDTIPGLRITPNLGGLTEGQHGTHVYQNPNCGPKDRDGKSVSGLAAGGHFDPDKTDRHEGASGNGHLGDLPVLYVDAAGRATRTMLAPRLKTSDLAGRAIVIHAGGDTYSDTPSKLGGGGARVACGVVIY